MSAPMPSPVMKRGRIIPILYTLTAEHFLTEARTTGVALTDGVGHIGGAIAAAIVLAAKNWAGVVGAFATMAATGVATAILLMGISQMTGRRL